MKHGCFRLCSLRLLVFYCGLILFSASLAKADSITFLNDFRSNDLIGTMPGFFKAVDGSVDSVIDQAELDSLKVSGSEPNHSVFFYQKNPRDVRGSFSSEQPSHVAELSLDAGASEALVNFISASAF